ncbi:MAG: YcxB family protein [Planctomycetota bacterium]|jgi:hypothetical protein
MNYKLTKWDVYKAYLLHIKPRRVYGILGILLICMTIITSISLMFAPEDKNDMKYGIFLLLIVFFVLSSIYLFPLYSLHKCYKQTKDIGSEIELTVENNSFSISSKNSNINLPYKNIFRIKSDKNYLLVYSNQYVFHVIPKQDNDLISAANSIEEQFGKSQNKTCDET